MLEYSDKIHNKIGNVGRAGIVLGIVLIIVGITIGTISIVFGANALSANKHLID
ncbi:MAG: hypothetical protein PF505_06840 [Vallitaleaceae bacterium]|jgi:hypothetical protein|nr:hypothetical protein [Vallitaleaceae bacterium]